MDICRWLRAILDYLGFDLFHVPRIAPSHWMVVHTSRHQGRRSFVRRLGSRLSRAMKPAKRINFQAQLLGSSFDHEVLNGSADIVGSRRPCANLADFNMLFFTRRTCTPQGNVRLRHEISADQFAWPGTIHGSSHLDASTAAVPGSNHFVCSTPNKTAVFLQTSVTSHSSLMTMSRATAADDTEAMKKISQLEAELARLREQIAALALRGSSDFAIGEAGSVTGSSCLQSSDSEQPRVVAALPPPPSGVGLPPPPPPPPPPPLPAMPSVTIQQQSVVDLINERRRLKAGFTALPAEVCLGRSSSANKGLTVPNETAAVGMPSMADVLKGLHTVKLRTIDRSPGGTPVRQTAKLASPSDPASLIAQALRKKFAYRFVASPDKENSSWEQQRHGSATTPTRLHSSGSPGATAAAGAPTASASRESQSHTSVAPFGPHLLKKSAHPKLVASSNVSPLATINA